MNFLVADLSERDNIVSFLKKQSSSFPIPLSNKVRIEDYVEKVLGKGYIVLAKENGEIAGVNMFYANDVQKKQAWISLICVCVQYRRRKIATTLLKMSEDVAIQNGMELLMLNVHKDNIGAIKAYERFGFVRNENIKPNEEYNVTFQKNIMRD